VSETEYLEYMYSCATFCECL